MPSILYTCIEWWASPYINHFIQPDTIIPSPANPQSWNRYSYVSNNPIRFNDRTGHMQDEDDYTCNGCTSSFPPTSSSGSGGNPDDDLGGGDEEENCVPSPGQWICDLDDLVYEPTYCATTSTYVDCWNQNLPLYMGEEPMNIDPAQWELLLTAIREQVHGLNRWQLYALALSYDTPFYNNSLYGLGELPGTGCIDQYGCFNRSELNYIAQGELWAAAGVDFEDAEAIVRFWKFMPIMHFSAEASGGTLIMLSVGYSDYEEHYPSDFP